MWADCLLCPLNWRYKQHWCSAAVICVVLKMTSFILVNSHRSETPKAPIPFSVLLGISHSPIINKLKLQCLLQQGCPGPCFNAEVRRISDCPTAMSGHLLKFPTSWLLGFTTAAFPYFRKPRHAYSRTAPCQERLRPGRGRGRESHVHVACQVPKCLS